MYLDFFSIKDDIQQRPPKITCEGAHPVIFFEPQKSSFPALETQLTPVSKFPKGFFFSEMVETCGNVAIIHHFVAGNTSHLKVYGPENGHKKQHGKEKW